MAHRRFVLSVSPEGAPAVRRVLELDGRRSLTELHAAILSAFEISGAPAAAPYAFFTSGRFWDPASAHFDPRAEGRRADKALLFRLGLQPGQSVAYLLGFKIERRFIVDVQAITEADEALAAPRVIEASGDLASLPAEEPLAAAAEVFEQEPPELGDLVGFAEAFLDIDDRLEPFEDELALARAQTEPWDDAERALDGLHAFKARGQAPQLPADALEVFREAAAAARALLDAVGGNARLLLKLDEWLLARALGTRLLDLPRSLSLVGETELSLSLARALSFFDREMIQGDIAIILAEAGRRDEALAEVDTLLSNARDAALVEAKAGDTYRALGDSMAAEAYYRRSLAVSKTASDRLHALLRLVACLTDSGREAEASELLAAARREREPAPAPRAAAVGRNDPCPCGSGKKYKKCHGA